MGADRHPIRLVVQDDLRRSRLTVFFRVLLALPHLVWLALWSVLALLVLIADWFATLLLGHSPEALHNFLARYLRYSVHVEAFVLLAANQFPGFTGRPGSYPIDLEIDPPARQNRWKTGFRWLLVLPAALVGGALAGGLNVGVGGSRFSLSTSVAVGAALLAWFVCLARARMPEGLAHAIDFGLSYSAQLSGYLLLLTDRYPYADPTAVRVPQQALDLPVRLRNGDDGARSRLTVFFRVLLAVPHLAWLVLWYLAALIAGLVSWFAALFAGRVPGPLHRFLARFVRYGVQVQAYLFVLGSPFPGFAGAPGSYPVDLELSTEPPRQSRWRTFFRVPMALPALMLQNAFGVVLYVVGLLGWFASLFTGREPRGLQRLGAWALGYGAQATAFIFLLTDHYPYTGPEAVLGGGPHDRPAASGPPEPSTEREPPIA
jgi:hypothetical protein